MTTEQIAELCHETNRAFCRLLGDDTQKPWAEAAQWQRDSALQGVKFRLEGGRTPEDQHEAWSRDKLADGWVYGDVKDAEKKTHPCLVPYAQLPLEQQIKDHLFGAIVDACKPLLFVEA